jgi:uncharacterized phage protein (TIGR01671 family)
MNDRFKFRVWDKENKCLLYPIRYSNFAIVNGTVVKIESYPTANSAYLGKRIAWEFDNAVIMQCTGLKDKNGKLIYEGDIFKYKDEVYGLCIGKIEWDNAHYEFQYYTGEKYGWFSHILCLKHIKNIEVIGNIYENKELLESEG